MSKIQKFIHIRKYEYFFKSSVGFYGYIKFTVDFISLDIKFCSYYTYTLF